MKTQEIASKVFLTANQLVRTGSGWSGAGFDRPKQFLLPVNNSFVGARAAEQSAGGSEKFFLQVIKY